MTTQPSDWAVAPKFGEWLRGIYASERNPLRNGMYVRTIRRTGRCNPGTFYELTDGKGKFWQYPRQSVIRLDRARELDASGTTNSAQISSSLVVGGEEGWLPIESAPRDGTRIILGRPDEDGDGGGTSVCGYWIDELEDGVDYMGNDGGFTDVDYQVFQPGRSFGAESYRYAGKQPTHWRPLPPAPRAAMGAAGAGGGDHG